MARIVDIGNSRVKCVDGKHPGCGYEWKKKVEIGTLKQCTLCKQYDEGWRKHERA